MSDDAPQELDLLDYWLAELKAHGQEIDSRRRPDLQRIAKDGASLAARRLKGEDVEGESRHLVAQLASIASIEAKLAKETFGAALARFGADAATAIVRRILS